MINIDGVIYGNFRCDLGGDDLNRMWTEPSKQLHPQVYRIKEYIKSIADRIEVFLDLHGHSKRLNTFSYSCKGEDHHGCRVLPLILSKLYQGFKIADCTFGVHKSKMNTLRAFAHKETQKVNVMTLEISLFGDVKTSGI